MNSEHFTSVWDAIEDTPEQAANMKLRSTLMMAIKDHIVRADLTQSQAARLLGVTQSRVSDLMRGKSEPFGLESLVNMATAADLEIDLQIKPRTLETA
ncbi:helix-turn-helix domain-containing protein [Fodinicurvata sediminis]|uniref:helix-turn-helix domain-containing protein n=1 Tax=Fodinicurvata sediminis TaxID=1121832 RepID=UPI0003B70651|nr:XRE family transcriptional regulator [Fodinicurvata sediminis]